MEKFIASVYSKPCLWDLRIVDFRNKTMVRKMWEKVEKECNLEAGTAFKKWKNLKDTFRRENRKASSKWILFRELMFLKDVMAPRFNADNTEPLNNEINKTEEKIIFERDNTESKEAGSIEEESYEGNLKSRHHSDSNFVKVDNSKKESIGNDDEKCNDDDYHFLMSFRSYLKQMPDQKKLKFRIKMQELVYNIMYADDSPQIRNAGVYLSEHINSSAGNTDKHGMVEYADVKPIINN